MDRSTIRHLRLIILILIVILLSLTGLLITVAINQGVLTEKINEAEKTSIEVRKKMNEDYGTLRHDINTILNIVPRYNWTSPAYYELKNKYHDNDTSSHNQSR